MSSGVYRAAMLQLADFWTDGAEPGEYVLVHLLLLLSTSSS